MPARNTLAKSTRPVDEKITINVGCVDLGQIDLLVQEGFLCQPHRPDPHRNP
jgi:hypothetical protein